jgi:hypothetical protein
MFSLRLVLRLSDPVFMLFQAEPLPNTSENLTSVGFAHPVGVASSTLIRPCENSETPMTLTWTAGTCFDYERKCTQITFIQIFSSDAPSFRLNANQHMITHMYEVRPRKDKRGVDLISDALLFGRLWYGEPNAISNAIGYAEHCSRSHDAVILDRAGNAIEMREHKGDFKEHPG